MKRFQTMGSALLVTVSIAACGGGEEAAPAAAAATAPAAAPTAPAAEMTMPDWSRMDESAMTVELDVSATMDGGWKFNGIFQGAGTITVPEGYTVTLNFTNNDLAMAHSIGIDANVGSMPGAYTNPVPVFEGAISSNATNMSDATLPGASETLTFVADAAGEYAMVCYIPGHAISGMWLRFNVSAAGSAGVEM